MELEVTLRHPHPDLLWVPSRGIQPIILQKLASLAISTVSEPQFILSYTVIYSVI